MDVDLAEGDIAHEFQPHHDHTGDPEKQNVEPGDESRSRIIRFQLKRVLWPSQRRERPEGRRKPGVEDVGVADELGSITVRTMSWRCSSHEWCCALQNCKECMCRRRVTSSHFFDEEPIIAVLAIPSRNLMAPPDLAGDAPIFDIPHPA